eukprot:1745290-Rhodomonas_salina.1
MGRFSCKRHDPDVLGVLVHRGLVPLGAGEQPRRDANRNVCPLSFGRCALWVPRVLSRWQSQLQRGICGLWG